MATSDLKIETPETLNKGGEQGGCCGGACCGGK